jgi:very-short-patch-repair endonuclease
MRRKPAKDVIVAALADTQYGVVARPQLLDSGLTKEDVDRRLRMRRLHRVHQGVYAVGHRVLTLEGRWMAAVLAAGPGAVLSHASAATAWDLRRTGGGAIDVSVATRAGRERRAGIRLHRSVTLTPVDMTTHRGIPITTPARTIIDLAKTLQGRPLEQLVDLADQRGLVDFDDLRSADPASLKAVLRNYAPAATRSEMEERFLRLCDDHGIPRPETNSIIEGIEVDFVWHDRRLIVEVDGYASHRSPSAFERDRERDVTLTTRGWRVLRFTWAKIMRRAGWVAASILAPWP